MRSLLDHAAFESLVEALKEGAAPSGTSALHQELLQAWQAPGRAYHTAQHLRECLELAQGHAAAELSKAQHATLSLALWFHDAVYDPKAVDNEERSARWARSALESLDVAAAQGEEVARLVLATEHLGMPVEAGGPLVDWMLDVDLAILGSGEARFKQYEQQIAAEYAWLAPADYRDGRRRVLSHFRELARVDKLYRTTWGRAELLPRALNNLGA